MCAIAGILKLHPSGTVRAERVKRMTDLLAHRGPDDSGVMTKGPVALGHRRLSIVDLAGGRQPMSNEDGSVCVVFNGEIYNHQALRAQLAARGHVFRTRCDTEAIIRIYEEFGDDGVERLDGMFAFALWDRRREKLLLARDRLGIKPLYYAIVGDELLFASEIKAILNASPAPPRLNKAALPEYLATRTIAGEETFFEGVKKLLPGRAMTVSPREGVRQWRWWRPPEPRGPHDATPGNGGSAGEKKEPLAAEIRRTLSAAARSHLMSDVPVGLLLSGGLDSSALGALAAPHVSGTLHSFTVGFDDPAANEMHYARQVSAAIGSRHHEVTVSPDMFFDVLPRLVWHEDQPIAFTSSVPLYYVCKLARRHVKVVLTGEGADELFLGYNRYRITLWNQRFGRAYWDLVPSVVRRSALRFATSLPGFPGAHARRSFLALAPDARGLYFNNFSVIPESLQEELLCDPDLLGARDLYGDDLRHYEEGTGGTLDRMGRADLQSYLVELLMKQDRMSMAASIESRVPYLDRALVDLVAAIPGGVRLRGWRTKTLLRDAVADLVPRAILKRRKMGFPVPLGSWLKGARRGLVEDLLLGSRALARGIFRPATLKRLVAEHGAGHADHAEKLWLLLNVEMWHRIFIDGEGPPSLGEASHA